MRDIGKEELQTLVERLSTDCMEAHRGAFWWDERRHIAICFGNDGATAGDMDERAQFGVAVVRKLLAAKGGKELGFATDRESGGDWTLACRLPAGAGPELLEAVLWVAWNVATDHRVAVRDGLNPPELSTDAVRDGLNPPELSTDDVVPVGLDWGRINESLRSKQFDGLTAFFTEYQANVARAVLERNGLV
jgi:hypothetical protein